MQLTLLEVEQESLPPSSSGKTSPAYSHPKTTPSDAFLARSLGKTASCSLQGGDGRTLVVCMDPKEQSRGGFLMPNISAWPNDAAVCSLSQVLEQTSIPLRYFLSAKACAGILRRAEKRGKKLPEMLRQALESAVSAEAREREVAACLTAKGQKLDFEVETFAVQAVTGQITHALNTANNGKGCSEDGTGRGVPTIAFSAKDYGGDAMEELSPTLRAGGHAGSHANAGVMPAVAFPAELSGTQVASTADLSPALSVKHTMAACFVQNSRSEVRHAGGDGQITGAIAAEPGVQQQHYIHSGLAVRRLTPTECERLQGFPDGHTQVPYRNKPAADGPRYKAIGNSMAVPCMRWIGERIDREITRAA